MSDFQAIADRVEIEALRGEFTDAATMRDRARLASLFTHNGAIRMPDMPAELAGREQIRAWGERVPDLGRAMPGQRLWMSFGTAQASKDAELLVLRHEVLGPDLRDHPGRPLPRVVASSTSDDSIFLSQDGVPTGVAGCGG
jgi:hypothetical protein